MIKRYLTIIFGVILLIPISVSDALGIDIDDFREEVYRPENLPSTFEGEAPAEVKINAILDFAINLILYTSGSVAVFFLVYGGIRYITSFGNQERMDAAKKTIKFAIIGLLAVILAFAVVTNVIDLIFRASV